MATRMIDLLDVFVHVEEVGERAFVCETRSNDLPQFVSNKIHGKTNLLLSDILSVMHGALRNFNLSSVFEGDLVESLDFLLALLQLCLQRLNMVLRKLEGSLILCCLVLEKLVISHLRLELGLAVLPLGIRFHKFFLHALILLLEGEVLVVGFRKMILKQGCLVAKVSILLFESHDLGSRMLFKVLHFSLEKLFFDRHGSVHVLLKLVHYPRLVSLLHELCSLGVPQAMYFRDVNPLGEELSHAVLLLTSLQIG